MSSDDFDALMAALDAPMAIVTTATEQQRAGCLIGFHSQSGMEPNHLSVWLSKANHTYRVATQARIFAVHFLTGHQRELARLFGTRSGDEIDKFERCAWRPGDDGVPVLDDCDHVVVGTKSALVDIGTDHVCVVLEPIESRFGGDFEPLRLSNVDDFSPGHEAEERPEPPTTRADH